MLEILSAWPLFGSSFFAVRREAEPKEGSEHILALNKNGVAFLDLITHETLLHYPFTEVRVRQLSPPNGDTFQSLNRPAECDSSDILIVKKVLVTCQLMRAFVCCRVNALTAAITLSECFITPSLLLVGH